MSFTHLKQMNGSLNGSLNEDVNGPIEISDVAEYFPNNVKRAVRMLSDKNRLRYKGHDIMADLYPKMEVAAKRKMGRDLTHDFTVDFGEFVDGKRGEEVDVSIDTLDVEISDMQDVYLGYHPKGDVFVMGFDAWMNEESFWEVIEKEFKKQGADIDSEEFDKVCSKLWKKMDKRKASAASVMVELEVTKSGTVRAKNYQTYDGIWYNKNFGGYKDLKDAYPGILDIRLD